MTTESLMESIYRGNLSERHLRALDSAACDMDRVEALLERYQEILGDFPPREIEQLGSIPVAMRQRMAEIGLFGVSIPQPYGGLGFNIWEYLRVVEGMARLDVSVAMAALAHLSIGVKGLVLFGSDAQKNQYLLSAAAGTLLFSYALTEPKVGSDARHIETFAELDQDGGHYLLNGSKTYITNANYAGALTVFAQLDRHRPGFMGAFIVETASEGVKVGPDMPKMGLKASSTAAIQFRNVRVPRENLLGAPGDGFKIAMTVLNYGRLALGAASVGMMDRSVVDIAARSASRSQFGVPIGSFPLIREKLVRARVHQEVASAITDFTAALLHAEPTANVAIESSHTKLFGTTRAWDVLYDALQVAGGAGYLATNPYEKRMRDFRVTTVFEGTTEIHSLYPALYALRQLTKHPGGTPMSPLARLRFLIQTLAPRTRWPLTPAHPTLRQASRLARSLANRLRRLLLFGLLRYGRKAAHHQFWLRRVTTLSLYCFALIALIQRIALQKYDSRLSHQEALDLLRYFMAEAKSARRANSRPLDNSLERLVGPLFESLAKHR